ncbi:hypothetical protein NUU61_008644 [Penicillium alfredii]|uniref:ATP-grasp domain-containing protein n=1 Tax=Penicillium alfredii TaxID=1506179 RepID=A0A9W9ELR6_9EURO|nr:uncharacterized protein NUU61_008644 [Penicillium alfredii]KAJ5084065.1 hypothetical protein NUU61_008644 [Penicillium alfredii]
MFLYGAVMEKDEAVTPASPQWQSCSKPLTLPLPRLRGRHCLYIHYEAKALIYVFTPESSPSTSKHEGRCFPDSAEGITSAVRQGATHLWANTIVFSSHPLQTATSLDRHASTLRVVGQPPSLVENFDDKLYLNDQLRTRSGFTMPQSWTVSATDDVQSLARSIPWYPLVGKPIRGRGSHRVKVCQSPAELQDHVKGLLEELPLVMLEELLAGEEATITVMPPSPDRDEYSSMPPITRFNHAEGMRQEMRDPAYADVMRPCEDVARLIMATAPIRFDVRRFYALSGFAIFDINMKPNMTGPGRPGREDQASLTALAATACGWDYPTLLHRILRTASTLETFRSYRSPF